MLTQQKTLRFELVQQMSMPNNLRQEQFAQALMLKGERLQAMAQKEIQMGQQMMRQQLAEHTLVPGAPQPMLAAINCSNTSCIGLEANGVNIDIWPQNWEITRLPGYAPPEPLNESEYNETLDSVDEDYDFYNRQPLLKAGVHIGHWFWEDEDIDEPPKNESAPPSPEEEAADEELEAILKKMENSTSPEERLSKAGIKVEGMPWDPEPDYSDEEDEEEEAPPPPAEKARPMSLKMRRQMQLKQMRLRQHVGQQLRATHTRRVAPRRVAPKPVRRLAPHKFQQANIAYVKGLEAYKNYRQQLLKKRLLVA